jgi:hypothetical protein
MPEQILSIPRTVVTAARRERYHTVDLNWLPPTSRHTVKRHTHSPAPCHEVPPHQDWVRMSHTAQQLQLLCKAG